MESGALLEDGGRAGRPPLTLKPKLSAAISDAASALSGLRDKSWPSTDRY